MEKIKLYIKNNYIWILTFLFIFGISYYLTCNSIWAADDYAFYNNVWNGIENFSFYRLFNRANWFYTTWTGRYLSTIINYFFLYFDKSLYNVFNAFANMYFIFILTKIIDKDKKYNWLAIILYIITWFIIPAYGQVMLWQIGSVIYLWMANLGLTVVYLFDKKFNSKGYKYILLNILLFIFAVIAGNGFETNSIVVVAFLGLYGFYELVLQKRKLASTNYTIFVGSFIGFLTNLLSPGNKVRMGTMGDSSLISRLFGGLGTWYYNSMFKAFLGVLVPLVVVVIVWYIIKYFNKKNYKLLNVIVLFAILFEVSFLFFALYSYRSTYENFIGYFYENMIRYDVFIIVPFLFLLVFAIILYFGYKKLLIKDKQEIFMKSLCLFIAAMMGIASYVVTPNAWERSYMFMCIFLLISGVLLIINLKISKKILIIFIGLLSLGFIYSFYNTFVDMKAANDWYTLTESLINEKIADGKVVINVPNYQSVNTHNPASIEKWVIPAIIDDKEFATSNGVHKYYEWINIEVTNYFFHDEEAWDKGCRIIAVD